MIASRLRLTNVLLALVLLAVLALIAMMASDARGGPLDPANGPASTMKTLDEVEPRIAVNSLPGDATAVHVISERGSYYLTDNVLGVTGKNGIVITSDGVTLDLNGFTINSYGAVDSLAGIKAVGQFEFMTELTIRNGTIQGFWGTGVDLGNTNGARISDITIAWSGEDGLKAGPEALITDCIVRGSSGDGIVAYRARITGCLIEGNSGAGVFAGNAMTISNNFIESNGTGIHLDSGNSIVIDNQIFANNSDGVSAIAPNNRIEGNHFANNGVHLNIDSINNVIVRNTLGLSFTQMYDIVAGNAVAPFESSAAALTTEHPLANFVIAP